MFRFKLLIPIGLVGVLLITFSLQFVYVYVSNHNGLEITRHLSEQQSIIQELKARNLLLQQQLKNCTSRLSFEKLKARNLRFLQQQLKNCTLRLYSGNLQKDGKMTSSATLKLDRPPKHKLAHDVHLLAELVTVILYRDKGIPHSCLEAKMKHLQRNYPKLKILRTNTIKQVSVGYQFNSLISKVNTRYFFLLNSRHSLSDHNSDNSVGWLLHAMENVPELDFVSGSLLDNDNLEIPCYRMKLCNWTLSQRYEYKRSIGELMICDNIASSFIGRMTTIQRIRSQQNGSLFDEKMTSLSTTDFMLTLKQADCLCGVRPEVIFQIEHRTKCNTNTIIDRRANFLSLLPFAHKHKVFRFRQPSAKELDLCDLDSSPILGEDICDESVAHKLMLDGGHWAYDGTFAYPFIIKNIERCMNKVVDYLILKKVPFEIEGGVALGTVKMGGILPWDAGDVDLFVYNYNKGEIFKLMESFARVNNYTVEEHKGEKVIMIFCAPRKIAREVGGLVTIEPKPENESPSFFQIKTNGRWMPYSRKIFSELRGRYGHDYLQHKLYASQDLIHCKRKGHNACLPDFRKKDRHSRKEGTYKDLFCDL